MKEHNTVIKNNLNIVFAIDDNYVQQCAVTIVSILANSDFENFYNFYILNTGLKNESKIKLESLTNIRDFNIEYIDVSDFDFSKFPLNRDWISAATYYRLLIPEVLPKNIDKCIYMDCDMIAEDDLAKLWNYDISNYYAGVVEDESSISNTKRLNLPAENNYFNAGMMILNLDKLREISLINKSLEYYYKNEEKIIMQDQDLLNGVLNGKCLYLPLRWNLNTPACFSSYSNHYYSFETEQEALSHPGIIHFTGKYKPWVCSSFHPFRNEYIKYLKLTNFKEDIINYYKKELLSKIICKKYDWKVEKIYLFGIRIYKHKFSENSFIENIFSVRNSENKTHKVITILGIKIKFKRKNYE